MWRKKDHEMQTEFKFPVRKQVCSYQAYIAYLFATDILHLLCTDLSYLQCIFEVFIL